MHQKSPKLDCLDQLSKVPNLTAHTENLTLRGIEFWLPTHLNTQSWLSAHLNAQNWLPTHLNAQNWLPTHLNAPNWLPTHLNAQNWLPTHLKAPNCYQLISMSEIDCQLILIPKTNCQLNAQNWLPAHLNAQNWLPLIQVMYQCPKLTANSSQCPKLIANSSLNAKIYQYIFWEKAFILVFLDKLPTVSGMTNPHFPLAKIQRNTQNSFW